MSQDAAKKAAAEAALKYVEPGEILGVGTGSTVNFFIDALAQMRHDIPGAASSSGGGASAVPSGAERPPRTRPAVARSV